MAEEIKKLILMSKKFLAFTLIELLVVIAIIGILSGLIVVAMGGITSKANIAKSQVFSNSLRNALMMNLVSEWKLDEVSGTTLNDGWSGGNSGTLVCPGGNCWKNTTDCISGSCLFFPGNDQSYIQIADTNSLHLGDSTLSFWVYNGAANSANPTLFNKNIQTNSAAYWWAYTDRAGSTVYWQYSTGTSTYSAVSWLNALPINNWAYATFVFDNTNKTVQLLVNGVSNGLLSIPGALPVATGSLFFGSYQRGAASNYAFGGKFDEIRLYSAVIPTSQIKENYYAGLNKLFLRGNIRGSEYQQRLSELENKTARN